MTTDTTTDVYMPLSWVACGNRNSRRYEIRRA
jgi:hypothetical protein